MPLPKTKKELLKNIRQAYLNLDEEVADISVQHERLKSIEIGLCPCDIIAYQIGWGDLLLGWEHQELEGSVPEMPAQGYRWNQLKELALSFYAQSADKSLSELRSEFNSTYRSLFEWINSTEDRILFDKGHRAWAGEKWPLIKWIQVNTIAPYRSARTKIRRWKKEYLN